MQLNGQEYSIDDLIKDINFEQNIHHKINNQLNLTTYQVEVLNKFNVDYQKVQSFKELIFLIEDILNDTDDEELELILDEIAERDYYENTNK